VDRDGRRLPRAPRPPRVSIGPITREERAARGVEAFTRLPADMDVLVLFDDQYVHYYSGFVFTPTERPMALVITREGERTLFVPRLELEHAQLLSDADRVVSYPEYPGERHPILLLLDFLEEAGLAGGVIGVDFDGYPPVMGYRPFPLSDHARVRSVSALLDMQMAVKSPAELELIRESIRWGDHAHRLLQEYTRPGMRENEVVARACKEATEAMNAELGTGDRAYNRWISGALAIYRGQIGPASALPHALANNAMFEAGQTLVTGAGADVFGYLSELERTMFIGEPSAEQRRFFDHMMRMQDISFAAIRAGVLASSVDVAVRNYIDAENLWPHWRHHVGHSLGLRIHESPFLDIGDDTELQAGMVFSIEPGLYVPGVGGFRHSDTILVTEDGCEVMTFYPRELEQLILPA